MHLHRPLEQRLRALVQDHWQEVASSVSRARHCQRLQCTGGGAGLNELVQHVGLSLQC